MRSVQRRRGWMLVLCSRWFPHCKLTRSPLLDLGGQLYTNKQEYDEMDDRDGNPRRPLAEFMYDGFFRKYGLRQLAERRVVDVVASISSLKRKHPRVRMFAQFCGLGTKLPLEAMNFMFLMLTYFKRCVRRTLVLFLRPAPFKEAIRLCAGL